MDHETADDAALISRTAEHVRALFISESSGHDWYHIERVWHMARRLAASTTANLTIVELAALLHDIADWKFHDRDLEAGPRAARAWLAAQSAPEAIIVPVCAIIATLSFKGAGVATPMATLEGQIVQDADRLDALGAIGIARAFAYGGHKGRAIYDPERPPHSHADFAAYAADEGTTINHFYEKLLLLKDRMQTPAGRAIAEERHAIMEQFLAEFFREWHN